MRNIFAGLLVLSLLILSGCDAGSSGTPGGPGATNPSNKAPLIGQSDDTFALSMARQSMTLKQGETQTVSIGIKRGKNFGEDVTLKFGELPKGVSVDAKDAVIKKGDADAKIVVKAADDAALGDFTIKVMGHPPTGADAVQEWKITIAKK